MLHWLIFSLNTFPQQGIDIWLEYGSALGAVREGGIIKGDHDIDMAIWSKDWAKFKDILINTPLNIPTFSWVHRGRPWIP